MENRLPRFVVPLCIALLLARWVAAWFSAYPLSFDEAQYWFWGQHPAWGYYSKPPVLAWLIWLSTHAFGDSVFGVTFFAPLLQLAIGVILYRSARLLGHDARVAGWVLATYVTLPLVTGNSAFFSTDVPLQFCWALALYAVLHALLRPRPALWWLLAGFIAGLGLLSKYTMIAFAASTFAALLLTPERRRLFATPWPWAAAIVTALVFTPNILWNAAHQFVTFHHTDDNVFSNSFALYPNELLTFIAAQFGLFGPILMVALLLRARHMREDALLHCYVWPLAIAGCVVCLLAGAQAHWIEPVYLAATLIAVPYLAKAAPRWLRASLLLHLFIFVLFYAAPYALPMLHLKHDPLARLYVWNDLATPTREALKAHPTALVVSDERKIAASLTYALRGELNEGVVYKWNPEHTVRDHYDMLTQQAELTGKPLILVTRNAESPAIDAQKHIVKLATPRYAGVNFTLYYIPRFEGFSHAR